jgi:hypothetical protein
MKLIRPMALLAAVGCAALVLGGAGSASAVTLCKEEVETCPEGKRYPAGTSISAELKEGTSAVLLTSLGTVTCTKSSMTGKTSAESGSPLKGTIEAMSTSGCTLGGTACTVTWEKLPYTALELLDNSLEFHTIHHFPLFHLQCGSGINCKYTASELLLKVLKLAGGNGLDTLEELTLESGFFCSSTVTLHMQLIHVLPLHVTRFP